MSMDCRRCHRTMRHRGTTRDGRVAHKQRGLCGTCVRRCVDDGTLSDHERMPPCGDGHRTVDTAEDFEFLTESMGVRCKTNRFGWTRASMRHIAARLNITLDALEHALDRARKVAV